MGLNSPRISWLLIACLVLTTAAEARPCAPVPAEKALSEATLVVKGSRLPAEGKLESPAPGSDLKVRIQIHRVLKGHTPAAVITTLYFACSPEHSYALETSPYFLAFIDERKGALVRSTAAWPASAEVGGDHADPKDSLREEFRLAAESIDPMIARSAIAALAELDGLQSIPMLTHYARNDEPSIRYRALAHLAQLGDPDAVEELVRLTLDFPFAGTDGSLGYADDAQSAGRGDIMNTLLRFSTERFTATLMPKTRSRIAASIARLTTVPNRSLRRSAFQVLRELEIPAAQPRR